MPRKTKKAADAARQELPAIPKELIDQFVTGPMSAEARTPAEVKLERFHGPWGGKVDPVFREYAF